MKDSPIFEVTLRKYEPPSGDPRKDVRFFLLSMGLIRPGDQKSPLETIFRLLLDEGSVAVSRMAEETGITESAVRYHLERLKALRLVEGRKEYRIAEGDLAVAFRIFRKYVLEEILDRTEIYVNRLLSGSSLE